MQLSWVCLGARMLCFVHLVRRMSVCGRVPGMYVRAVTNDVALVVYDNAIAYVSLNGNWNVR